MLDPPKRNFSHHLNSLSTSNMAKENKKVVKSSTSAVEKPKVKKEKTIPVAVVVSSTTPTPSKKGAGRKGKISNAEKVIWDIIGSIQVNGIDTMSSALKTIKKRSDEDIYKFLGECAKYKTVLTSQTFKGGASMAEIYNRADGDTKAVYDGLSKCSAAKLAKTIRQTKKQIADLETTLEKLHDKVFLCEYYHSKTDGDLVVLKQIVSHLQDFTNSRNQDSQDFEDLIGYDQEEEGGGEEEEEETEEEEEEEEED